MNLAALAAASRGDLANALIAAAPQPAAQAESAQGVPDGWRMVPVEPTPKMVAATWYDQVDVRGIIESHNTRNRRIYCAMIEAAPLAAAQAESAKGSPAGFALVSTDTLAGWKTQVNTLAMLSGQYRRERTIKLKQEIADVLAAAPQPAAQPCLDKGRIRAIFMDHGFTIKEGQSDLKEYVYDAANALLAAAAPQPAAQPALCDSCNGSGEAEYLTSHLGPDDYSVSGQCMTCGGSGVAAPQPAAQQERKPYDHPDDDDPWLSGDDMMGDN